MNTTHTPRRRSPWRLTRRVADILTAQLVPGRHYQFRGQA